MKIGVPVRETSQKMVKKRLSEIAGKADLAEIWLDQIQDLDLSDLFKNKPLPVVCVCKKTIEKGKFKGTYRQAFELLLEAAKAGADYIDVPYQCHSGLDPESRVDSRLRGNDVRVIGSYHNFKKTPSLSQLMKKAILMHKRGVDVVKIATQANSFSDALQLILLANKLQEKGIRHIIIGMGKKGILTRILTPTLGGEMMFGTLNNRKASAPGQLPVKELKKIWSIIENF